MFKVLNNVLKTYTFSILKKYNENILVHYKKKYF